MTTPYFRVACGIHIHPTNEEEEEALNNFCDWHQCYCEEECHCEEDGE
tara:strand:- start:2388 stop:2531 length:144 start_codon:yes stop_codon:yes gene_type:complete